MAAKADLVIKNGLVCTETEIIRGGLAVKDGIIVMIGPDVLLPDAEKVYDAQENLIFPGIIEPHYHPGNDLGATSVELYTKDVYTESRSAVQGGITTTCATTLPNGTPLRQRIDEAESAIDHSFTDVRYYIHPYTQEHFDEVDYICNERGVSNFKFLLGYRGDNAVKIGIPREGFDTTRMFLGFEAVAKAGGVVMVHCEDPAITEVTTKRVKEEYKVVHGNYLKAFSMAQPGIAEAVDICKSAYIANFVNAPLYVVHTAAKETVDQIQFFQEKGYDVTCETCVPYLVFTCDDDRCYDNDDFNRLAKVGPPIHEKADQDRLWLGINEGTVNTVGTDHIAYVPDSKFKGSFWDATIGSGDCVSCSLMLMLTEGIHKNKCSLDTLRKVMSENVAKAFNIYPKKGTLKVGSDADITIIDLSKKMVIDHTKSESNHCGCEFDGIETTGAPIATFIRGQLVAENFKVVAEKPLGEIVKTVTKFRVTRNYR